MQNVKKKILNRLIRVPSNGAVMTDLQYGYGDLRAGVGWQSRTVRVERLG